MRWGERQFTSLLTIPVEPATKPALLSWDQLLVFDIELDNQKQRLFFFFGIERDDMLKRVLA